MCVCVCTDMRVYVCFRPCKHAQICLYMCVFLPLYACIDMRVHVFLSLYTCTNMCLHMCFHLSVHYIDTLNVNAQTGTRYQLRRRAWSVDSARRSSRDGGKQSGTA